MTERENYLRTAHFQYPERIPVRIHISDASWDEYREELQKVAMQYPEFFPQVHPGWRDWERYQFPPGHRQGEQFLDNWGCIWESPRNGLEGVVTHFPLENWNAFKTWHMPDIENLGDRAPRNWQSLDKQYAEKRAKGELIIAGLPHGFLFLRATYLRGFENALCDMLDEDENFEELFLVDYNLELTNRFLALSRT